MSGGRADQTSQDAGRREPAVDKVLLVGHCGFDASSLKRFVRDQAAEVSGDDVQVDLVNDEQRLSRMMDERTLLLVNRVLDGRFGAASGPALIEQLNGSGAAARMLLISDYADAQADAEAAGALPGFGKRDVGGSAAADRLRAALLDDAGA